MTKSIEWIMDGDCIRCTSHASDGRGYPTVRRQGKPIKIGRRILIRRHGELSKKIDTRHSCDNRWCINPAHLSIGTRQDNINDMMSRGRHRTKPVFGEAHGMSKLKECDIRSIRESKASNIALAKLYSVSYEIISLIRRRKRWRHVR